VGEALQNPDFFWRCSGKLKATYFTTPRLARIWAAMEAAAEKGRPPTKTWVPMFIQNDKGEDDPLVFYLNLLVNDANADTGKESDAHAETVFNLAAKRSVLDALEQARIKIMKSDFGTPPEHLQDIGMKALATSVDADYDKDMRSYEDWGDDVFNEVSANVDRDEEDQGGIGLSCGLKAVEDVIGRLMGGKVYILAGMSGAGKSALARQITEAAMLDAQTKKLGGGYVASLEMTGKEYAIRSISQQMGIPADQIERGAIERAHVETLYGHAKALKRFNITVDSKPNMGVAEIKARMQKTKIQRGGLALAVWDHLLIMSGEKGEGLFDKVSSITIQAKNIAKEFNIPIIILAQLNEKKILESGSGWPNASHLFGGETITQNADVVAFIHRHELVLSKKEPATETEAHAKWVARRDGARGKGTFFNDKRRGGAGRVSRDLRFIGELMTFEDI
jgi:replicative DNA helicase